MADPHDIYRQVNGEKIDALIGDPKAQLTQPVQWIGGIANIPELVAALLQAGLPERYQIKYHSDVDVIRISDWATRHPCEPGEYFWLLGDIITGGDLDQWHALHARVEEARS